VILQLIFSLLERAKQLTSFSVLPPGQIFLFMSAPEKDQCFAVEFPALMRKLLQLWAIANMDTSDGIECHRIGLLITHTSPFLMLSLKPEARAEVRENPAYTSKGSAYAGFTRSNSDRILNMQ
jgi:hypothetical protein